MEIELAADVIQPRVLPSLDRVRAGLDTPARRRTPMWMLMLAAMFAAIAGVSAAGVMIFGPGGASSGERSAPTGG